MTHNQRIPAGVGRGKKVGAASLALVAALVLSGCSPLLSLLDRSDRSNVFSGDGPDTTFESFESQTPNWAPCGENLECAEVFAPMDWNDEQSERITLALVRQPALGSEPALGSLFVNPGGPGASGVSYLMGNVSNAVSPAVQERYDVVGWDPRGVGASSAISCLTAEEMDEALYGPIPTDMPELGSDEWIAEATQEGREYGEACLERTGDLVGYVDTGSTVQDLDMLRAIVGDEKLNYLGYSYGTKIGARYADEYPDRVGRLVLDGALDPYVSVSEMVRVQTAGFEQALRAYVTDCLTTAPCFFTGSPDDALKQINAQLRQVEAEPITAPDGRTVESGVLLTAIVTALYSEDSWPFLDDLFEEISVGETETALLLADFYNDREDGVYTTNTTEAFNAINCLDYPSEPQLSPEMMRSNAAELRELAPTIGEFQGYGETLCADWPVTASDPVAAAGADTTGIGADPILVIGTTGDPATPYEWAIRLANQLESGVLITLHGEGHTAYGKDTCIDTVVDDYLLTGNAPVSDPNCALVP